MPRRLLQRALRQLGRGVGLLGACLLLWQSLSPSFIQVEERAACCCKAHGMKKCMCRRCTHDRDDETGQARLENCWETSSELVAVEVDGALPPRLLAEPPLAPAPRDRTDARAPLAWRALEVVTPPPLA